MARRRGGNQCLLVSPITVWEISRKVAMGRVERPALPRFKGRPMDRMLIAAALDRGIAVVTDDPMFTRYGVATVW